MLFQSDPGNFETSISGVYESHSKANIAQHLWRRFPIAHSGLGGCCARVVLFRREVRRDNCNAAATRLASLARERAAGFGIANGSQENLANPHGGRLRRLCIL